MRSIEWYFLDMVVLLSFSAVIINMVMAFGDIALRLESGAVEQLGGVRTTWGLQALVDLTQLAIMVAVPLAIASAFIRNRHIRIGLICGMLTGG